MDGTKNIAFVDGQNVHLGTKEFGWTIDHHKFRRYLREKYNVEEAYYFLGFISDKEQSLYDNLQKAGFIVSFRDHSAGLKGKKKGNVDNDIIFGVMRKLVENESFNKVFIISGDGDYYRMVEFLIQKGKFGKMLFPNTTYASSLYEKLGGEYFDYLDSPDVKKKIAYK
jgi:uncharacterized LabA/DUF88 family protein